MKIEVQQLSRFVAKQFGQSVSQPPRIGSNQSLAVMSVESLFAEMSRAGRRFVASPGVIANAQAPVADMPTTATAYALYNGEAAGGKSYVIDALSFWQASGTAGAGATLIAGVTGGAQAAVPAAGTGVVVKSASGSALGTKAIYSAAVAMTSAPAWMGVGGNQAPTSAGVGSGQLMQTIAGLFIVPPTYCLAIHVLAPVGTTSKFSCAAVWHEIELDLE